MTGPAAYAFTADHFRARGWWRDETLGTWLERCATARGERDAVITARQALSYSALRESVSALASGLHALGIAAGDIVAVHLPNIPEFLTSWLAINERGAVLQTIHMAYGMREIGHMLTHSGAKAVLALSELKGRSPAAEIAALQLPGLRVVAVGSEIANTDSYDDLVARGSTNQVPPRAARGADPFLLLYTSGTTS